MHKFDMHVVIVVLCDKFDNILISPIYQRSFRIKGNTDSAVVNKLRPNLALIDASQENHSAYQLFFGQ